ncbi:putative membrane protein [Mycobacterium avium subsp. avium 2285 (R)]|nr:putative membrane protein [Mycobacterium avium subsp. avium 2285 (R)]
MAAAVGAALVAAAFLLPRLNLGVRPRLDVGPERFATHAGAAPIFGEWLIHAGWGTGPAVALAAAVVAWGTVLAQRLSWRALTLGSWAVAAGWAFALAMIDGWQRGFAGRLTTRDEYLWEVPRVTDIAAAVRTFSSRIVDYQPHSWTTHVSGHPPGALLTFVWLDRLGLHGGGWAGLLCLLAGSSAAAAVLIGVRALADEPTARRAAPFVALAPTAIWVAVSADGYFAGVAAWGIALLAVAVHRPVRFPALTAAGAGLLLGWGVFCNYGLMLMGLPAAAVLAAAPGRLATAGRSGVRCCGRWAPRRWPRSRWRLPSPSPGSTGSTAIPLCSNAIGRASPKTGRSSTGAGPTWPAWCARSVWAASRGSAGCSTGPRSAGAAVSRCCCWRCWPPPPART